MSDVLTPEEREFVEAQRDKRGQGIWTQVVFRLVSEVERLRAASKAAFACIECDGEVKADEDGCCSNCGSDCFVLIGLPAEREILRHDISARFEAEVERLRARNEALEQVAKQLHAQHSLMSGIFDALSEPGKGGAT